MKKKFDRGYDVFLEKNNAAICCLRYSLNFVFCYNMILQRCDYNEMVSNYNRSYNASACCICNFV